MIMVGISSAIESGAPNQFILPVLRFHGYSLTPPALVSDFADGGDLRGLLDAAKKRSESSGGPEHMPHELGLRFLLHVALGMRYLHSRDVLHCDLKPENILIRGGMAKVGDFGLSAIRNAMTGDSGGSATRGTLKYLPPEAFDTPPIRDKRGDVFAFGVIAHEVLVGRSPYATLDANGICNSLVTRLEFNKPFDFNEEKYWNLIRGCTSPTPFERLPFSELWKILEEKWCIDSGPILANEQLLASQSAETLPIQVSGSSSASTVLPSSLVNVIPGELPLRNRIVLQVGNGNYGPPDDPKYLPMAGQSVDLFNAVLGLFYGFTGSPEYDLGAPKIRELASSALRTLKDSKGTDVVHLVGHGGDLNKAFVFEGIPGGQAVSPQERTVDLETDIVSRIEPSRERLVVALLDCCRSTMGTDDRPFNVDRDRVVIGFAAGHGQKAYGCLYTFLLAEELWKRFDRQDDPFSWRSLLEELQRIIISGTALAAQASGFSRSGSKIDTQAPQFRELGTEKVDWSNPSWLLVSCRSFCLDAAIAD
jgi:serine/threonine protein kinase